MTLKSLCEQMFSLVKAVNWGSGFHNQCETF